MTELITHLLDLLQPLGKVSARRMFGGYGLYLEDRMFGLVAEGTLYLKVDADSEGDYAQAGLPCFRYLRRGRPVSIRSFRQAPRPDVGAIVELPLSRAVANPAWLEGRPALEAVGDCRHDGGPGGGDQLGVDQAMLDADGTDNKAVVRG